MPEDPESTSEPVEDPESTSEPVEDPTEDTPDAKAGDTDQDTQQAQQPVDWEARYKEVQSRASKLEQQNKILLRGSDGEANEGNEPEDAQPEQGRQVSDAADREARDAESWQLAELVHGSEVVAAYEQVSPILLRSHTPADYVAGLEAYHQARLRGETPKVAAKKAPAATAPAGGRVDANRPDAAPDASELDKQEEAAVAKGDTRSVIRARLERLGIGR